MFLLKSKEFQMVLLKVIKQLRRMSDFPPLLQTLFRPDEM
jgi:hypothetical protein